VRRVDGERKRNAGAEWGEAGFSEKAAKASIGGFKREKTGGQSAEAGLSGGVDREKDDTTPSSGEKGRVAEGTRVQRRIVSEEPRLM